MTDQQPEGELEFIARRLRPLATEQGALALKDDAALLAPTEGHELVITADTLVADVHFRSIDPIDLIAQKALLVNLSDLAAKGATPRCYFLQVVWPKHMSDAARDRFVDGLAEVQTCYGLSLMGGDTTASDGPLTISVTMIGQVPMGAMVKRSGANPGDDIWVTGKIGNAALALSHNDTIFQNAYLLPSPPTLFGTGLYGLASAGLDISDGLVADAQHLASRSHAVLQIDADLLPLSDAARSILDDQTLQTILTGGDDYQILFTAAPSDCYRLLELADETDTEITKIGTVGDGPSEVRILKNGRQIEVGAGGFTHF